MIDGTLARKINATSELGLRIDSVADMVFVICSAILVLPSVDLPVWVWLWIATIGSAKLTGIIIGSYKQQEFSVPHSITNKLTGILLFCLPFAIVRFEALISTNTHGAAFSAGSSVPTQTTGCCCRTISAHT